MRSFISLHPIWFSTGVMAGRLLLIIGLALGTTALGFGGEWQGTFVNAAVTVAALGLTAWLGWWRETGLTTIRPSAWWPLIGPAVVVASYLPYGVDPARRDLLPFLLGITLVGVNEELFYRGVVQHALTPLGRWRCCLLVGALFGAGHVSRHFLQGASAVDTSLLVVETAVFGFAYAAVRYRTSALLPLIVLHAAEDIMLILNSERVPIVHTVAVTCALAAWGGVVLARRERPRDRRSAGETEAGAVT
ncbi:CPBP family intramembrane glutamic endopeptidase [Planobispora rosea]|nr:CPBP family intramembrane glutamic endopeptidase [Planobispora rosea]